jgi:hypothetical protein
VPVIQKLSNTVSLLTPLTVETVIKKYLTKNKTKTGENFSIIQKLSNRCVISPLVVYICH